MVSPQYLKSNDSIIRSLKWSSIIIVANTPSVCKSSSEAATAADCDLRALECTLRRGKGFQIISNVHGVLASIKPGVWQILWRGVSTLHVWIRWPNFYFSPPLKINTDRQSRHCTQRLDKLFMCKGQREEPKLIKLVRSGNSQSLCSK